MNRADLVNNIEETILSPFRRLIAELGLCNAVVVASRHDGRIENIELRIMAHRDRRQLLAPGLRGAEMNGQELTDLLLDCLDESLRNWVYQHGSFEFKIADMKLVHTAVTISIRPNEEWQLSIQCDEGLFANAVRRVGSVTETPDLTRSHLPRRPQKG